MMIWQPSREVAVRPKARSSMSSSSSLASFKQIVPFRIDDHMAGRAGERALAGAFDIDLVPVGDLEHRQAERRLDLAPRAVAFDKDHLRHRESLGHRGAAPCLRRGSRRQAPALRRRDGEAAPAITAQQLDPGRLCWPPHSRAASAGVGRAAKTSTAWVTGRPRARSARSRAPSNRGCHVAGGAIGRRHRRDRARTPRDRRA